MITIYTYFIISLGGYFPLWCVFVGRLAHYLVRSFAASRTRGLISPHYSFQGPDCAVNFSKFVLLTRCVQFTDELLPDQSARFWKA